MADPTPDQIKDLDLTRQRLLALHNSLKVLRSDLQTQNPLPSWSAMQSHASVISSNLQAIAAQLSEHQQLLSSTVVHPLPQFPAKHQESILQMLLRTKLEPDVEEWLEQGQAKDINTSNGASAIMSDNDRNELWQWAPSAANAEARKQKWGADFTLAEQQQGVKNVATGLQRELIELVDDEPEEDEEDEFESEEEVEDDEDKMEVETRPKPGQGLLSLSDNRPAQMTLESIHKFMTTGKEVG